MGEALQRLWLVRHGETQWNKEKRLCGHTDIPLSEEGRRQVRWLAGTLQHEPIDTIYTSDLSRARETAEIIASQHEHTPPIIVSSAWREVSFGAWEGLTYSEIAEQYQDRLDYFTDPEHVSAPEGESLTDVWARLLPALQKLRTHTSENSLLVGHGGMLRVLLCRALGVPLNQQWQWRIDTGSCSILDLLPYTPETADNVPQGILSLLNMHSASVIRQNKQKHVSQGTKD